METERRTEGYHRFLLHRLQVILLALSLALVPADQGATRETGDRECIVDQWTDEARKFVLEATQVEVPETCIKWAGQDQLNALFAGPVYGAAHPRAAAAFLGARNEILLSEDLDPVSVVDRSYLVHELIHAQQFARRARKSDCLGMVEGEAYSMQARYLRGHGLKQEAFLFQVIGMLQSACGIDY